MKRQRIVFRADASKHTGYGHFIRSLALADYLKDDFDCIFTSYNEDEIGGILSEYQYLEIIKICNPVSIGGLNRESANDDFIQLLKENDIVVLDNYYYDTLYQQKIKGKGCSLVCLDDMHQYHMVCDLLITVCPVKKDAFSLEPYTDFRGGIEWMPLRNAFLKPMDRSVGNEINRIVLAMGGADAFNLTGKMIEVVKSVFPVANIDVICGDTAKVKQYDESTKVKIHNRLSDKEIAHIFDKAHLGVFPASTICIEAFSRELPVIVGYYADNQIELYNYCVSHRLSAGIGCLMEDPSLITERLITIMKNKNNRPLPVVFDFKKQKEKIIELFKAL